MEDPKLYKETGYRPLDLEQACEVAYYVYTHNDEIVKGAKIAPCRLCVPILCPSVRRMEFVRNRAFEYLVTHYGSKIAKELLMKHILYPCREYAQLVGCNYPVFYLGASNSDEAIEMLNFIHRAEQRRYSRFLEYNLGIFKPAKPRFISREGAL